MAENQYNPSTTALCFDRFKEAALYFDHVIPLNMSRMRGTGTDVMMGYPEEIPSVPLAHLIDANFEGDAFGGYSAIKTI